MESAPTPPWYEHEPYGSQPGEALYQASCHCGAVRFEVTAQPVSSKLCHCKDCQKLHGAPFEWVCIFHKRQVRFVKGAAEGNLYFWSSALDRGFSSEEAEDRELPVKVSCTTCRTPIADEGRNMWLAYGPLFDFEGGIVPEPFKHSCHIFYGARCMEFPDDKPKWAGHKNTSELLP
ncbi:unnamed protein product [Heterosigma akashiwo]|mmetsp:Transcript_5912/g.8200  ORF Transcript_5912/g.8200 Transcript_5912/m.8200 type:complete len:176 (+) Transcript_5912:1-528(+)